MLASILIIAVSLVLFYYWFRYTCVLILSARTSRDYGVEVAEANGLSFLRIQRLLKESAAGSLDLLEESLERDYRLLTYLFKHAAAFQVGGDRLEHVMLRVDFHVMKFCYSISRKFAESRARVALEEMSQIVAYFANAFGERLAVANRA